MVMLNSKEEENIMDLGVLIRKFASVGGERAGTVVLITGEFFFCCYCFLSVVSR